MNALVPLVAIEGTGIVLDDWELAECSCIQGSSLLVTTPPPTGATKNVNSFHFQYLFFRLDLLLVKLQNYIENTAYKSTYRETPQI